MEYRFFYRLDEDDYNSRWRGRKGLEERTDIYFILPSPTDDADQFHLEHGLKLRKEKKLELKRRERRLANGQEYWLKPVHADKRASIKEMNAVLQILGNAGERRLVQRVQSADPLIVCYVSKLRQQSSAGRGLTQESTGLRLRFVRQHDQVQLGDELFFETVCLEHAGSNAIGEAEIQRLSEQYSHVHIEPMGYPEFLFRQYKQMP